MFLIQLSISAQTEYVKWEAKSIPYKLETKDDYQIAAPIYGTAPKIVSAAKSVYKFMISDLDGDNCPFYPSCSQFYVDAVNETGILKGTLMFVDRFARDINFLKGWNHYPLHSSGKFFDPAHNYSLNPQKINLQPTDIIAD